MKCFRFEGMTDFLIGCVYSIPGNLTDSKNSSNIV